MRTAMRGALVCFLLLSFAAGCVPAAPVAAPAPVVQTVVVEKEVPVEVTRVVEVEKEVPAEPAEPAEAAAPAAEVAAGVQEWEVVNPAGIKQVTPLELAPRLTSLEGKTVGLKWNEKPGGDIFLDRVAELLEEQVKDVNVIKIYEAEPSTVPQTTNAEDAKRKAQLIAALKPDIVIGSQCD